MSARRRATRTKARKPEAPTNTVLAIENATIEHMVRHARHQIATSGERLAELGETLQDIGGLVLSASSAELRRAGVRAQADCTLAMVGLMSAMISAERIALLGDLRAPAEPQLEEGPDDV